uniref:Uncharacterized protein n=1 Tax=Mycena chlorophos TaxID=658473 RepID=A0ABQ0KUN6_MYCCL|nr:predicted protein [Mycena chlorophos]
MQRSPRSKGRCCSHKSAITGVIDPAALVLDPSRRPPFDDAGFAPCLFYPIHSWYMNLTGVRETATTSHTVSSLCETIRFGEDRFHCQEIPAKGVDGRAFAHFRA